MQKGETQSLQMSELNNQVPSKDVSASARYEELLGYGRFQKFQVWVFMALVNIIGAINMFQLTFTVTRKPFRCSLPPEIDNNFGLDAFANHTNVIDECTMAKFNANRSECLRIDNLDDLVSSPCIDVDDPVSCQFGYTHEREGSDAFWSLSAENNWVCDKEEYGSNVLMAQNIGIIVNSLIMMQLSDAWGRRPVFILVTLTYLASRLIFHFIPGSYIWSLIVIGLGSGFFPVALRVGYTMAAEYTNEQGRLMVYMSGWIFWVFGVAVLAFFAWLCGDWFSYGMVTTLANLLIIPFFWLAPESPRLLLTHGKIDKAEKIIRSIKKINNEPVGEDLKGELRAMSKEMSSNKAAGITSLFSSVRMVTIIFLFCITWTVNDFFYVGGQLNVENLAGNQFVNFAVVAMTDLPSVFIGEFFMDRFGRRWCHVVCMGVTTVLYLAITVIANEESLGWLVTVLAVMAKTMSNIGWFINYVQNMEIFPTSSRVSGIHFCAAVATVIGTSAPYVILLGDDNPSMMYSIFGLMGILGTIGSSFLPETLKADFPDTVEDIENRPRHPYFSWKVWE